MKPTMEFRWLQVAPFDYRNPPMLQQKWIEVENFVINYSANTGGQIGSRETGKFEWRGIPLVIEEEIFKK